MTGYMVVLTVEEEEITDETVNFPAGFKEFLIFGQKLVIGPDTLQRFFVDMNDETMSLSVDNLNFEELVLLQVKLENKLRLVKEAATITQKQLDYLRKNVLPAKMEDLGISDARIKGLGKVTVVDDFYCHVKKDQRGLLEEWLHFHGHDSIISNTINASSLKSLMKELMASGDELPPLEILKITPYSKTKVTKTLVHES